ncbi:MAG: hypothetical protein HOH07_02200 [Euryarchaeota archaeon]|jgi:hypothetical protein|nr:hypothetical protein [Euryarchaeota archaeon]
MTESEKYKIIDIMSRPIRRRKTMDRFTKFIEEILDEQAVLSVKKAVPKAAPILKKLANGVYGQKIKNLDVDERIELSRALEVLMKILEK